MAEPPATSLAATRTVGSTLGGKSAPPWRVALATVAVMVRNVVVSGFVAVATAFLTSRGNVFGGVPPRAQPRTEFLTSSLLWTHLLLFFAMHVTLSMRLAKVPPLATERRRSVLYWFARILQVTALAYAVSVSVLVEFIWLYQRYVSARLDYLKLEYYTEVHVNLVLLVLCDARARHLYRTETAQGRRRVSAQPRQPRSSVHPVVRAFVATIPTHAAILSASVFVQVVSQTTFPSPRAVNLFLAGSLVFKLVTQELIKHFLLTHGKPNVRAMCALVMVPTVIIDTQVRVVILRVARLQSSVTGSYMLAVAEVWLRTIKVLLLRWKLQREQQRVANASTHTVVLPTAWRQKHLTHHMVETHADMYAEYIAILCSAAIAALWSGNPHYAIGLESHATASLWTSLAWQAGLEVLVDYVASVIEIHLGATVAKDTRDRSFATYLGFISVMLVIANVNISAMLYIRSRV